MTADPFMEWRLRVEQARTAVDADQAEVVAVRFGATNVDEGIRDDAMSGELADEQEREDRAATLLEEIDRRSRILGGAYPFSRERNALRYRQSDTGVYEFCLSITVLASLSTTSGRRYQIAFERLVRDSLKCFLGAGAVAYRTGAPGDRLEKRPAMIDEMIKEIAALLNDSGEWVWKPDPEHPYDPSRNDAGDLGIDVVAWKPMPDRRRGNLFLVAQCACGEWEAKSSDISKERLEGWIKPITFVPFVKVFAIPFHVPNVPYFGDLNREYGLMFDRARLSLLAEAAENRDAVIADAPEKYSSLADAAFSASQVVRSRRKPRRRRGAAGRRSQ